MNDRLLHIAGAYIAWELHIGSHYCKASTGEGSCDVGDGLLRRLHTAYAQLDEDDRSEALLAVREWDWEDDPMYPRDDA